MMAHHQDVDASRATHVTVDRFNYAFGNQDLEALGDLITDDCVFDTTEPAPDGTRFSGREGLAGVLPSVTGCDVRDGGDLRLR